jgi:branched-chain amino acid aminotransferase
VVELLVERIASYGGRPRAALGLDSDANGNVCLRACSGAESQRWFLGQPNPDGHVDYLRTAADFCEPRHNPEVELRYRAPGAYRTEIQRRAYGDPSPPSTYLAFSGDAVVRLTFGMQPCLQLAGGFVQLGEPGAGRPAPRGRDDVRMRQTFDPRNADIVYWANGVLRHRDEPGLSPFDSVVQGGDAVWEGLRLYDGRIFGLHEHLDRLYRSARALGFAGLPARDEVIAAIRTTLAANAMRDGVHVRLTLTRGVKITSGMDPRLNEAGCTLVVLAEHKPPVYDTNGLSLITASIRRPAPGVLDAKIHHNNLLNSILAKMQANAASADDAIMLDDRGFVAETNATNLFVVAGRALYTPYAYSCPEGITRATILALAPAGGLTAQERDLSLTDFYTADEVFCTGTMGEVAGVVEIDGRPIGAGTVGPVTALLAELYQAHAKMHGVPVVA